MIDHKKLAHELIQEHVKISNVKNQINAITTALIGALGSGHNVNVLEFDTEELKKLDLSNHIQIFKETGKDVSELEHFLRIKYDELEKLAKIFRSQNSDMKCLFKMSPNSFLNQYFIVDKMNAFQLQSSGVFQTVQENALNQKVLFNFIPTDNELKIFFKTKEDLYKLQQIFCRLNVRNIDYSIKRFVVEKDTEEHLPYLYI